MGEPLPQSILCGKVRRGGQEREGRREGGGKEGKRGGKEGEKGKRGRGGRSGKEGGEEGREKGKRGGEGGEKRGEFIEQVKLMIN